MTCDPNTSYNVPLYIWRPIPALGMVVRTFTS